MTQLIPRKGYVVAIPVNQDNSQTKGGLLVPDIARKAMDDARFALAVVERCEGCEELKSGDRVLILKHEALLTEFTGEERILCGNDAVFCRVEE